MRSYTNPVHDEVLADPFVLKWNGRYYCYCTPTAGAVPVLVSDDLVSWTRVADVLPAPAPGNCYWAPEVAYDNGTFFLFYSVGGFEGEGHQVRVATSSSPLGPFEAEFEPLDPGVPFSIDASPFKDRDGQWYLFSCRDFLDGQRVGTGIVVHPLARMRELTGGATVVVRPHAEWHLYERARRWYDRVWDWYTVEGPFVVHHGGRYWCFFSGGAWRAENYGVSWAVADHPLGPWEACPPSDGAAVLRTVTGAIGPGHASVVLGPDNIAPQLVYHAWDPSLSGRRLCVDALVRDAAGRPAPSGPSTSPRPAPAMPHRRFLFDGHGSDLDAEWMFRGAWRPVAGELEQANQSEVTHAVVRDTPVDDLLVEVNAARRAGSGTYGAVIATPTGDRAVTIEIAPEAGVLRRRTWIDGDPVETVEVDRLRTDFAPAAYHQMLLWRRGGHLQVVIDGVDSGRRFPVQRGLVGVFTDGAAASFSGISLTSLGAGKLAYQT